MKNETDTAINIAIEKLLRDLGKEKSKELLLKVVEEIKEDIKNAKS